ncbi:hypothetical protein ACGYK7_14635 [Sulfitobacter sp. 1A15299]|tara:strand:+ start:733 stop:1347 length:615 start_codon:yes stop_codon:yes gene_type:complete
MSALTWFLWPFGEVWEFSPEPLSAFLVAFGFWIFTEFKLSEEVTYRASTPNDIRLGAQITAYGASTFRKLLKDHDYQRGIPPRYLSEADALIYEFDQGTAHFQDKRVQKNFSDFIIKLNTFSNYLGTHSSPERFGASYLQSIIPANQFDGWNISDRHKDEINETNRLATEAWKSMKILLADIKDRIPETFDDPIEGRWFRSTEE